jgi:pyrroline-5-carboxylate reductase
MGEIIAAGIVHSGKRLADEVYVTDVSVERVREVAARHGLRSTNDNLEAVRQAGILLIAVKPQDIDALLRQIAPSVTSDHLLISVAAGVPTEFLEQRLPTGTAIVRVMPNAAAQVGEGMAAICLGSNATEEHIEVAEGILSGVGRVVRVPEGYMDAVTALSGSGPAYLALFAEAMIEAGVLTGLPRAMATELVIQTMVGTAAMMREGKMLPVQVREAVTSPGGTTVAALLQLEQAGIRAAVLNAVQAATDRSKAMIKERKGPAPA